MSIEIEINGKLVQAEIGQNIIEVTDNLGVSVPRFCYHKKLSIAANCRMCLVDIEGTPKAQPACSTPVNEGMKIWTNNDKAKKSQQAVMEFLLINHPLDCPICDQGGECELQDVAVGYGQDFSVFTEGKRVMADKDLGPLIQTDMTRCIHCTRCIRFGTEIAGLTEMGSTGRGENLTIEPFLKNSINSELSGNMIDVCPVGALTSKPFRYELRSWEMLAKPSIARHDNVGSALWVQCHKDNVKRVVARENEAINQTWISDRDRFSYEGLQHKNRLTQPKIKIEEQWKVVDWQVALDFAFKGLNRLLNTHHTDDIGSLVGNVNSLEEYYLLAKWLKALEVRHLDYRLNQQNFNEHHYCASNTNLETLEKSQHIVLIGGNTRLEQPMLNHRIRQASLIGAKIDCINIMAFDYNFATNNQRLVGTNEISLSLGAILKVILTKLKRGIPDNLASIKPNDIDINIAQSLLNDDKSTLVLGEHLSVMLDYDNCMQLSQHIVNLTHCGLINASKKANALAAQYAGFLPSKQGYDAQAMLNNNLKGYVLMEVYPSYDFLETQKAIQALNAADFVISLQTFEDDYINACANVILPITSIFESSGSHINCQGDIQFSQAVAKLTKLKAEVKPGWKVIKVLADMFGVQGFDYCDMSEVQTEITHHLPNIKADLLPLSEIKFNAYNKNEIQEFYQTNAYCVDALLRHSKSLQASNIAKAHYVALNNATATKLNLSTGSTYKNIPIILDKSVADNSVFIYSNQAKIHRQEV